MWHQRILDAIWTFRYRWAGIVAGAIGCISAIWRMPYYPIWSLTYIALGALVIYAHAAYGGNAEAVQDDAGRPSWRPRSDPRNHPEVGEETPDRSNAIW